MINSKYNDIINEYDDLSTSLVKSTNHEFPEKSIFEKITIR